MQEEQTVVDIHIADGGTRLAIGRHVGQLIVAAECLSARGAADAARNVHLLAHDVLPDAVDGAYVCRVASQGCHVGHATIHIGGTNSMTHGFVLFDDGFVCLAIVVYDGRLATIVKQELCLVQVFLVARHCIKLGKGHLWDLMPWHHTRLSLLGTNLTAHTVGIAYGNVEEGTFARCLIMGNGTLHHVAKVVKLVTQVLFLHPACGACPIVGVLGVHRASGIEIAIGLLCRSHDGEHRVDVGLQFLVGVGLQEVACALNGLIHIGIVEGISFHLHLACVLALQLAGSNLKVLVASLALALRESQGDGHVATRLQALPPKRALLDVYARERHRRDGVALGVYQIEN